jgi:hypothetical protein
MSQFPRTTVGGVSLPRMIIGTNWFCGYSHQSVAKDRFIKGYQTPERLADVIEVYLEYGIDAIMGYHSANPALVEAERLVQDRTGRKLIVIDTPGLGLRSGTLDWDATRSVLDESMGFGATFLLPHTTTTDALLDPLTRSIRYLDRITPLIRERGMIPGLSTHRPETPVFADESKADVETYIQIYNALGFLMHVEVDWAHRIIQNAEKPVMAIKPLAAGRLLPLVGFAFVWATLRDQDMVTVGALTPDEAREDIELSLSILERRSLQAELQATRSKKVYQKVM